MTTTITASAGGSTTPLAVDGYEADQESRNIIHDLLNGDIAAILIEPRPRSGTLRLAYATATAAFAALQLHALRTVFTLTNTDVPGIGMSYVVADRNSIELLETRKGWVVAIGFQEVIP